MQLTNICEVKEWVEQNTSYRIDSYEYVMFTITNGTTMIASYLDPGVCVKQGYYNDNSLTWMFSGNFYFSAHAGTHSVVYSDFKGDQTIKNVFHPNDIYLNCFDMEPSVDTVFIGYVLRLIKK